jgi:hypothetical protein
MYSETSTIIPTSTVFTPSTVHFLWSLCIAHVNDFHAGFFLFHGPFRDRGFTVLGIICSPHNFYTYIYIDNITCLYFGRKEKKKRKNAELCRDIAGTTVSCGIKQIVLYCTLLDTEKQYDTDKNDVLETKIECLSLKMLRNYFYVMIFSQFHCLFSIKRKVI